MQSFEARACRRTKDDMTRILLPLMMVLGLTACSSKSDPPKESAPSASAFVIAAPSASVSSAPVEPSAPASASAAMPAPAIPTSIDPDTVTAVIVWQKDAKARGGYRSVWIEREGDKSKIIGERPGILFMSSTSLWTLETTVVKGCSQYAHHPNGDLFVINGVPQRTRPDMDMPELARISDGKRVAPWKDGHGYPYTGTQCDAALEEYSVSISFDGGMGPFVVVRMGSYTNAGGAHGFRAEEYFTINLEIPDAVKLLPREADRAALVNNAAKGLSVEVKEVNPAGTLLLYGPNGAGLAVYRYSGYAPYVGGLGGNSYSNDFEVSSKNIPVEVSGYGKLPAWTLSLLKPKSIPIFMVPAAQKDLFKSQFDAAYVAGAKP